MKKIISVSGLALALFFGLVFNGKCAVNPPRDITGKTLPTIDWVGASGCVVNNSTGTNQVLCASGRTVVYGVLVSSVSNTDFIVFRDTATANLTSSTATIVYANGTNANATGIATQFYKFPVPIRFSNGVSVNVSVAPTSANGPIWTIFYRPLSATE